MFAEGQVFFRAAHVFAHLCFVCSIPCILVLRQLPLSVQCMNWHVMWEFLTAVFRRDPCEPDVRDSGHG